MNTRNLFTLALLSVSGVGFAQNFFFAGPVESIDTYDPPANLNVVITNTATVSTGYTYNGTLNVNGGTLTEINTATYVSEARVALTNSAFPTNGVYIQFNTTTTFTGTFNLPAVNDLSALATTPITTAAAVLPSGSAIPTGSTWDIRFYESADDGIDNLVDAEWTNLSFALPGTPPPIPSMVQTFSFAGPLPSIDAGGDTNNTIVTASGTTNSYFLASNSLILLSASIANVQAGSLASHVGLRMFNSAYPSSGMQALLVTNAVANFTLSSWRNPTLSSAGGTYSTLTSALLPPSSSWTFEVYEGTQNGTADLPEANLSNLSFGFRNNSANVGFAYTLTSSVSTYDYAGDPSNTTLNLGTVSSAFNFGPNVFIGAAAATRVDTNTLATHIQLRLKNSAYPCRHADIRPFTGSFATGTISIAPTVFALNVSRPFVTPDVGVSNLNGLTIPAGSTFSMEAFEGVDNGFDAIESTLTSLSFSLLTATTSYSGATFTQSFTALGPINASTAPVATPLTTALNFNETTVKWFSFDLPSGLTASNFLDIYTAKTGGNTSGLDTAFGVFAANGHFIGGDDQDGGDALSAMSFGTPANPRAGLYTSSVPFNGRDGACLEAGTYYIAVLRWNSAAQDWANGFVSGLASTASSTLDIDLRFQTDLPAGGTVVSGTVDLGGLGDPMTIATEVLTLKVLDSGGNTVATVTTSIDSSGAYSVNVPVTSGTYTLQATTPTSLRKNYTNIAFGSPVTQNITLINGNCDLNEDNNEIGPGDLQIVLDNFGQDPFDPRADVDNDLECGPGDLQIVLDNFGTEGD
jgi:hypothetical protein